VQLSRQKAIHQQQLCGSRGRGGVSGERALTRRRGICSEGDAIAEGKKAKSYFNRCPSTATKVSEQASEPTPHAPLLNVGRNNFL